MRRPFVLAALLVAMIAGGCGDGDNGSATTTAGNLLSGPAPTKPTSPATGRQTPERFVAQADAICGRYLEKAAALPAPAVPTRAQAIDLAHQFATLLGDQTSELASLDVPPKQARDVRTWLAKQRRLQGEFAHFIPGSAVVAQRIERLLGELKTQSIALGLQKCFVVRLGSSGG
jgi:hypothetical protein